MRSMSSDHHRLKSLLAITVSRGPGSDTTNPYSFTGRRAVALSRSLLPAVAWAFMTRPGAFPEPANWQISIRATAYARGSGLINMLIENRPNGPVGVNFSRQTLATGATCISGSGQTGILLKGLTPSATSGRPVPHHPVAQRLLYKRSKTTICSNAVHYKIALGFV